MTTMENLQAKWAAHKGQIYALAIGLVVGPFVSNYMGWQVTASKAQSQVIAGILDTQAEWCETRARAAVAEPGKLDWSARLDLAKKWSIMPGETEADSDVASACERKLQA